MSNTIRVLAFAGARDVIGRAELELELPAGATVTCRALMDQLCGAHPGLTPHRGSIRMAVNGSYAFADEPVSPGDEVALIPPVAGG